MFCWSINKLNGIINNGQVWVKSQSHLNYVGNLISVNQIRMLCNICIILLQPAGCSLQIYYILLKLSILNIEFPFHIEHKYIYYSVN